VALLSRAALVCALSLLSLVSSAAAGPPGKWTCVVCQGEFTNTLEVGVARDGNGVLNVLWTRDKTVFNTRIAGGDAKVLGTQTVFVYDDPSGGVQGSVALLPDGAGGLRAFFGGLYPDHPLDVGMATATSADGVNWAVQPTLASDSKPGKRSAVYAAAGIGGTIANGGTPISIWGDSAPGEGGYHVGTSDQTEDFHFGPKTSATIGGPNAGTDSATGQIAIAWSDLDAGRVLVEPIFPAGPRVNTPGGEAPDALERVAMTGRDGAGIFVAYLLGTNGFLSKPAVWRIGAAKPFVLSSQRGARFVGVARGESGRLWAFWARDAAIYARRSNKAATAWGTTVKIKPPGAAADPSVFSLEGEGTAPGGMLDLLALVQRRDNGNFPELTNWHQRIRPGIALLTKSLGQGKVRFTTRDAGAKLATTIHFAGKTVPTGPDGVVEISAQPRKKKYSAGATRDGYHPASRKVKVK
jgi:hypothetical protein